jgi:hypothetical protein
MDSQLFSPYQSHDPDHELAGRGKSSRRDFLTASAAAIASAFLPASVLSLLDVAQVEAHSTKQALLPTIPAFATNPYAQAAIARLTALLDGEKDQPFAGFSRSTSAFEVGNVGTDTLELIRAYNYEDSPLKASADCLKAIIARCDCMYSYAKHVRSADDYGFQVQLSEILLMLTELMPAHIDTARMTEWKGTLDAVMQAVYNANTSRLVVGDLAKVWTNADVRTIAAIAYSGMVLGLPKYRSLATIYGIRLMDKVLQPDGGVNYSDEQNDCFAYHPVYVTTLARLWQVTGEKAARDLVAATQWYIPVSAGAFGAAEYYTAPSWKQVWDTTNSADAAAIVVGITGNTHNAGHLKHFAPPASLFLASFYRGDVTADGVPNSYIFYDQNIKGPRGRNGNYSFAATGRTTLGSNRGKSTFVGCMVSEDPHKLPPGSNGFLVNAALAGAGMEVTTSPKVDYNQSVPADLIYLVQRETVATTASERVGAVSSHHRLSAYQHVASDWFVTEAWLLTPERLVGLVDLHALSDQLGCSIKGVLKFVSGCGDWGVGKEFIALKNMEGGNTLQDKQQDKQQDQAGLSYTYGALTARIVEHDFADVSVSYVNTFNDRARKSGRLVLSSQSAGVRMYPLGTSHFFVAEIHPTNFAPAKSIRRITDQNGLIGLAVEEANGLSYKLLVNDTSGIVDLTDSFKNVKADAQVHTSGECYRLPFLPPVAIKQTKSLGKLAELASLANLMDVEGRDAREAAAKDDDEPDSRLLLKPYRHKIIISSAK